MWYRGFVYLLSLLDRINHKKTIVLTMLLTHHIVSINNTKHNSYRYKILKKKKICLNLISSTKGGPVRDIARKTSKRKNTYLISWILTLWCTSITIKLNCEWLEKKSFLCFRSLCWKNMKVQYVYKTPLNN